MARLLGPAGAFFRRGWGAALSLGVGALLPAALAPGCVSHSGAKIPWAPRLAQDAMVRETALGRVVFGRGSLRIVPARLLPSAGQPPPTTATPSLTPAGSGPTRAPALSPLPGPCGDAGWFSPAPGAVISQVFGVPDAEYAAGFHTGVDFAVFSGTPLLAITDSVVQVAGWGGAYGNRIVLQLPEGHFALYAHMSRLDVRTGDHVPAGSPLGLSGESGNARGPHLHFEIRTEDRYGAVIDPLPFLRAHRCRV